MLDSNTTFNLIMTLLPGTGRIDARQFYRKEKWEGISFPPIKTSDSWPHRVVFKCLKKSNEGASLIPTKRRRSLLQEFAARGSREVRGRGERQISHKKAQKAQIDSSSGSPQSCAFCAFLWLQI